MHKKKRNFDRRKQEVIISWSLDKTFFMQNGKEFENEETVNFHTITRNFLK
jgi:hypothetical protein